MYGLGGMYGGTMGMGMGGMYGSGGMGGYGLGGGMYGGGMNSGLYNSGGLGGGLYNNNNSSIYGGYGSSLNNNNNLLGSSGLGNNNVNNSTGSLLDCNGSNTNNANSQGVSLLPPPPSSSSPNGVNPNVNANELSSPINQTAALPPLNEDPADRARRLRNERRKRRQLIKQHRDQLRQVKMKARLEILGHFTNVLVQTLRSTMELFAVCFGTYYSMKAVRAFSGAQQVPPGYVRAPNGQLIPAINGNNPNLQLQQQQQLMSNSNKSGSNLVSNNTQQNVVSQDKRSK